MGIGQQIDLYYTSKRPPESANFRQLAQGVGMHEIHIPHESKTMSTY